MRINAVALARAAEDNLAALAGVTNIDRAAIGYDFSVYVCNTARAGCQNGHFATGARRSRIEQGKKLAGVGNINRNTTRFSALERDVPPGRAPTPRCRNWRIGRGSLH